MHCQTAAVTVTALSWAGAVLRCAGDLQVKSSVLTHPTPTPEPCHLPGLTFSSVLELQILKS